MTAFDDTDWSRYLLGACTSGSELRSAVVRNAEQVARLRAVVNAARQVFEPQLSDQDRDLALEGLAYALADS